MITMDLYIYKHFLHKKQGDTMCDILNRIKNKSANELLEESGQTHQIPVNLMAILDTYDLKSIATDFKNLEKNEKVKNGEILGLVLLDAEEKNVGLFYREKDSEHRQRFTIAHELGHCCLHSESLKEGYIEFRYNIASGDQKEIAANTFAGELLIPEHSLNNILQRLYVPTLKGLSEIFNVSISVMRKRLELLQLSYYDDMLGKMITPE